MKLKIFSFFMLSTLLFSNEINVSIKDTPMENFYKEKLGKNITNYHRYAQFFLDSKVLGNKQALKTILSSEDQYLKYYEAIVKGIYNYYLGDKKIGLYQLLKAYDRENEKLKDSFEGLMVENIFLKESFKDKLNLISSDSYCETLSIETDRNACKFHMASKYDLLGDNNFYTQLTQLQYLDNLNTEYLIKYSIINKKDNEDVLKSIKEELE